MSQDTKIIIDTPRRALQYFYHNREQMDLGFYWGKPQKQERNFSLGSHHENVSHMLKKSGSYYFNTVIVKGINASLKP